MKTASEAQSQRDGLTFDPVDHGANKTRRDAAMLAFEVLGKEPELTVTPTWLARGLVRGIGLLSQQFGDLADFIVTAGEVDAVAPRVEGAMTLRSDFEALEKDGE